MRIMNQSSVRRFSLVCGCLMAVTPYAHGQGASSLLPEGVSPAAQTATSSPDYREATHPQVLVSLDKKERTLEEAILSILKQGKLRAVYQTEHPAFSRSVSQKIANKPVMEAIHDLLKGTGLVARLAPNGETVLIREVSPTVINTPPRQQFGVISGRITDSATGKGLPGVTLKVGGETIHAVTSETGNYRLRNVPVGVHTIEVRGVGYRSVTRAVTIEASQQVILNIQLRAAVTTLNEVVTSVTGTQRKIEIGNDVTSINADSVMKMAPITSVTDLLEGRVPGLTVTRSSGVPGAPSRLRLRGIGGGLVAGKEGAATNDPIVIVDGLRINASQSGVMDQSLIAGSSSFPPPSPLDQIDPNTIERIDVYKGPSAAAMYGSDAANGVIVITTKKGAPGSRWTATVNQGIEYLAGTYTQPGYYVFCSRNIGRQTPEPCKWSNTQNSYVDSVVRFQALNVPVLTPFSTGDRLERTLSVSGGQGQYTYQITGTLTDSRGLLKMPELYQRQFRTLFDSSAAGWMKKPNAMKQQSVIANFTIEPRAGLTTTFITRITNNSTRQSAAQLQIPKFASEYIDTAVISKSIIGNYATKVTQDLEGVDLSASFNWRPRPYFPMIANLGTSRKNRDDTQYLPVGMDLTSDALSSRLSYYSMGAARSDMQTLNANGTLILSRVSAAMGINIMRQSNHNTKTSEPTSMTEGIAVPRDFGNTIQSRYNSATGGWFIEPRLNLNSRFFINPGFRFDGSTLSGSSGGVNKGIWNLFPKLNFSWIALERDPANEALGFISMLRPRVSFGIAGVQPAPGWQLRLLERYDRNSDLDQRLQISTPGNPELRPERTREVEGGFDLDLIDGRVRLSWTQYHKLRIDAIQDLSIAPSVYGGLSSQYRNVGKIRNTGVEFSLSASIIDTRNLRWTVNTAVSKYQNKLLKLNGDRPYISVTPDGRSRLMPGYPVNGRWEKPIIGYHVPESQKMELSDVIIADSAVYVGEQAHNFEAPIHTSLDLLGGMLGISASLHYKDGLTQFNNGSQQTLTNLYYSPDATFAEQAIALAAQCTNDGPRCSKYGLIQTVSTLRLNSLSVTYSVPRHYAQKIRIPSIQVSLQGSNLGLWTNYRGKDPDVNSISVGEATEDNGQLPMPRNWRLQIRLGN